MKKKEKSFNHPKTNLLIDLINRFTTVEVTSSQDSLDFESAIGESSRPPGAVNTALSSISPDDQGISRCQQAPGKRPLTSGVDDCHPPKRPLLTFHQSFDSLDQNKVTKQSKTESQIQENVKNIIRSSNIQGIFVNPLLESPLRPIRQQHNHNDAVQNYTWRGVSITDGSAEDLELIRPESTCQTPQTNIFVLRCRRDLHAVWAVVDALVYCTKEYAESAHESWARTKPWFPNIQSFTVSSTDSSMVFTIAVSMPSVKYVPLKDYLNDRDDLDPAKSKILWSSVLQCAEKISAYGCRLLEMSKHSVYVDPDTGHCVNFMPFTSARWLVHPKVEKTTGFAEITKLAMACLCGPKADNMTKDMVDSTRPRTVENKNYWNYTVMACWDYHLNKDHYPSDWDGRTEARAAENPPDRSSFKILPQVTVAEGSVTCMFLGGGGTYDRPCPLRLKHEETQLWESLSDNIYKAVIRENALHCDSQAHGPIHLEEISQDGYAERHIFKPPLQNVSATNIGPCNFQGNAAQLKMHLTKAPTSLTKVVVTDWAPTLSVPFSLFGYIDPVQTLSDSVIENRMKNVALKDLGPNFGYWQPRRQVVPMSPDPSCYIALPVCETNRDLTDLTTDLGTPPYCPDGYSVLEMDFGQEGQEDLPYKTYECTYKLRDGKKYYRPRLDLGQLQGNNVLDNEINVNFALKRSDSGLWSKRASLHLPPRSERWQSAAIIKSLCLSMFIQQCKYLSRTFCALIENPIEIKSCQTTHFIVSQEHLGDGGTIGNLSFKVTLKEAQSQTQLAAKHIFSAVKSVVRTHVIFFRKFGFFWQRTSPGNVFYNNKIYLLDLMNILAENTVNKNTLKGDSTPGRTSTCISDFTHSIVSLIDRVTMEERPPYYEALAEVQDRSTRCQIFPDGIPGNSTVALWHVLKFFGELIFPCEYLGEKPWENRESIPTLTAYEKKERKQMYLPSTKDNLNLAIALPMYVTMSRRVKWTRVIFPKPLKSADEAGTDEAAPFVQPITMNTIFKREQMEWIYKKANPESTPKGLTPSQKNKPKTRCQDPGQKSDASTSDCGAEKSIRFSLQSSSSGRHYEKREVSPEKERSSSLLQEEPEPPHIEEEQEELEPPHIEEELEELEPPHIEEELEEPEPPRIEEELEEKRNRRNQSLHTLNRNRRSYFKNQRNLICQR